MTRYFIGLLPPVTIDHLLRTWYQHTFHQPLKLNFLHCSLISPFFTSNVSQVKDITTKFLQNLPPTTVEAINTYNQRQHILHLELESIPEITILQHDIASQLAPFIAIDTNPFTDHQIPKFAPHMTLDYHYPSNTAPSVTLPIKKLALTGPILFKEIAPTQWEIASQALPQKKGVS